MTPARIVFVLGLMLAACAAQADSLPAPLPADVRQQRVAQVRAGLEKSLEGLLRQIDRPNPEPTVRDLPNAALVSLLCRRDPQEARKLLRLTFSCQETNEAAPNFGSVPWRAGHPEIVDANSDEFSSQALGPIWLHYGDKLGDAFKEELRPHIRGFLAAMARRVMRDPSYTNIFLMRATNTILLGQAIGDTAALQRGTQWLDDWLDYTRRNGIREFDSPTYYLVDLDSLYMGYAYATDPAVKARFKMALDLFWTDIAANYMPARGCISGPNSRNYSFLNSNGGLDWALFLSGFRAELNVARPDFEKVFIVEAAGSGYEPAAALYELTRQPERIITARWDAKMDRDRYSYLTTSFEIGCANGDYGAQDKLITVELASAKPEFPVIAVVPDVFDAPYGMAKTPDHSGHMKPTHLPPHPTVVQDRGTMLALLDLNPADAKSEVATLATNILLPAKADTLMFDGRLVPASQIAAGLNLPCAGNGTIAVREGGSGVVIRILHLDGYDGQPPHVVLKADAPGLKAEVLRLALYHYQGAAAHLKASNVRVALLLVAKPCADDAALAALLARVQKAPVENNTAQKSWLVGAELGSTKLEAMHDLTKRLTLARRVNGKDAQSALLTVNGVDWMAKTLGNPTSPTPNH